MLLIEKYEKFRLTKLSGRKTDARDLADEIIELYLSAPDLEFVYTICEQCEHKLDHFIWKRIVLPELTQRMDDDPRAVKSMIHTIQNLYSSTFDWQSMDYLSLDQLTTKLIEMCPADPWARQQRASQLSSWFDHVIHEWPRGILFGMHGATIEECGEILEAVEELRATDLTGEFDALCDDVKNKTLQYRARLAGLNN